MKPRLIYCFLFPVVSAVLTGCTQSGHRQSSTEKTSETVTVARPRISTVVLYNEYPGYLTANKSVDVVAKVNGEILQKNYESGSTVSKGQVLFTIDPSVYRNRVTEAQSALTTAKSNCDYAREHYEAVQKALASDAVSKMEVIQAQTNYEQAQASIKNAEAALEMAKRNLAYCTVVAPISGMATSDIVSTGNYISGEAEPVKLATIYDNTSMTANFAIEDERYLAILNSQQSRDTLDFEHIPLTFSEPLPHEYTGALTYMAPNMMQSTGTMKMECKINNPYNELRPGMYVKVRLPYAKATDAIIVDNASVATDQQGNYMYVVNDSNRVVYTPVETGELYEDSLRIITGGLKPDDRYVTRALLKVKNGMTVNPVIRE